MKITHYIRSSIPFPVQGYGGSQRIAYWIGKAQAEMGHEVTFLCQNPRNEPVTFAKVKKVPKSFADLTPFVENGTEIVHLHDTPNFDLKLPFLVTMHGNGAKDEEFHPNTVFVSADHAARHGWKEYVHNAVDLSEYPFEDKKDGELLFLAKACWLVKNLPGAVRIANRSGKQLKVAGGKAPFWLKGVTSYGVVGGPEKLKLLKESEALLFPVIWDEPFGVAVIEALACGTPVVATKRGALPEIVDETSGVLANSFDELVEGISKISSFSPEACRSRVAEKFTHIHMAESYLSYYKKILRDGFLAPDNPKSIDRPRKVIRYEQSFFYTLQDSFAAVYLKE